MAEYDVFLTPPMEEHIYLMQFPNRRRAMPYNNHSGSTPREMRIKPMTGFLEMDVELSTKQNFNKYMGLKWGDADRAARELHNLSGTYGPAAGLTNAKPRSMNRAASTRDPADRELDYENDLLNFEEALQNEKVHDKLTLGGQIIRHDAEQEQGKPLYFVGAFQNNQLHLTKVTGTAQMRPNFHHIDAEEERARVAVSRAQADLAGAGPAPAQRTITQHIAHGKEQETAEIRLQKALKRAQQEPWMQMDYVDEEKQTAYEEFERKLKVQDVANMPHLKSEMDNEAYLDAISTPRHESPTRRRKRPAKRRETVDLDDEIEERGNDGDAEVEADAVS